MTMNAGWRVAALLIGVSALLSACGRQSAAPIPPDTTVAAPTSAAGVATAPSGTAGQAGQPTPSGRVLSQQDPALEGEDVRTVQQRLLDLGYREVGSADGVFGPKTVAAVTTFQAVNGLTVDGVVGPETWARLQSADATPGWAVAPLATDLCSEQVLLGASFGGAWFGNQTVGNLLRGGEQYRVYTSAGRSGAATGSAPQQHTPFSPPLAESFFVTLSPPPTAPDALALGGQWDPLPRAVTVISGTAALDAYSEVVRDFLLGKGFEQPLLGHDESTSDRFVVWRADLDGDGGEEAVINAQHVAGEGDLPGEYSLVLVLRGGALIEVLASVYPNDVNDFEWSSHQLIALLDANGDGALELLVNTEYFESEDVSLHELSGGAAAQRLSTWCGV